MDKKFLVGMVAAALGLGVGLTVLAENWYWDNELKAQLAQKDELMGELKRELEDLSAGVGALKETNDSMRTLIETSLKESTEVARSNRSSVEKLRAVILRLEALQRAVSGP